MKKTSFLFLLITTCFFAYSQHRIQKDRAMLVDSLLRITPELEEDSLQLKNYLKLAQLLSYTNVDSAIFYYQLIEQRASGLLTKASANHEKLRFLKLKGRASFYLASIAQMRSDYTGAIKKFRETELIQKKVGDRIGLAKTYNFLSRIYERQGDYEQFFTLGKKAYQLQIEAKDTSQFCFSLIGFASYYELQKKSDSTIHYYEMALQFLREKGDKHMLSYGLYEYANALKRFNQYEAAIGLLFEALEIYEKMKHDVRIARTMASIGTIFCELEELDQAEHYFKRLEELANKTKSIELQAKSLNNFGRLYCARGEHQKSLTMHQKALSLIELSELGPTTRTNCLTEIGKQYEHMGNSKKAISFYEQSLQIGRQHATFKSIVEQLNNLSRSHLALGELTSAQHYAEEAMKLGKRVDMASSVMTATSLLAQVKEKQKAFDEALHYFHKAATIKDSLTGVNIENVLVKKEAQYKLQQRDAKITNLEREQEFQELKVKNQNAKLSQQRQQLLVLVLGFLFVISLSLLLFNRYKQRQKSERLVLERQQEKTSRQLEMAELRSDFFTNVSHEFRTPLTLILGPLENLLSQEDLANRKDIERIHRNSTHLLSLVNETLDLSKLESGHLPLTPSRLKLGEFVSKVAQDFLPLSEAQQIQFTVIDSTSSSSFCFDPEKLKKVLVNLLGNAFKHTSSGGKIELAVSQQNNGGMKIVLQDNGSGIAEEHLHHIFERFYQADTKGKGTGVGLALTKQLIELHGGSISVESKIGQGSLFTILLPVLSPVKESSECLTPKVEQAIDKQASSEAQQQKERTVLIIEDNDEVRLYLKDLLEPYYSLLLAKDGQEGIELAETNSPELIISDVMMPHKNGFELTQHLKQNIATSHIPIILLTAKVSIDSKLKGLEIGADDYLGKPFNAQELLHRCKNLLMQREKLRTLFSTTYFVSPQKLSQNKVDQDFLERATAIVEKHLDNSDLTIALFCKEIAYNRTGVHLKLKALTGKNTSGFIRSIRLKKAAELLQDDSYTISEVADKTGFGTRQAFNKAFKEQFDLTPTVFRTHKGPINQ